MSDTISIVSEAVNLLEKYESEMCDVDFYTHVSFNSEDMSTWKNTIYPALVPTGVILDDLFFFADGSQKGEGIGNNGTFLSMAYYNFLYRCYKYLYTSSGKKPQSTITKLISQCSDMLEKYIDYFYDTRNQQFTINLRQNDLKLWKETYFPQLVETDIIPDYSYFNWWNGNKNVGIGADGQMYSAELFHFLMECFRYLYKN